MARIFVSHSSKDNDFGVQLMQNLRRALGEESAVWYDVQGGLKPGDSWLRRVEQEIRACDIFLFILSPNAMNSDWVQREYEMALVEKKTIIPVLHRSCELSPSLKTVHYISFLPPQTYEAAFSELLMTLGLPTDLQMRWAEEERVRKAQKEQTKQARQFSGAFPPDLYAFYCANCGSPDSVKFLPRMDRPLVCMDCFKQHRPSRNKPYETCCAECGEVIEIPSAPDQEQRVYCIDCWRVWSRRANIEEV